MCMRDREIGREKMGRACLPCVAKIEIHISRAASLSSSPAAGGHGRSIIVAAVAFLFLISLFSLVSLPALILSFAFALAGSQAYIRSQTITNTFVVYFLPSLFADGKRRCCFAGAPGRSLFSHCRRDTLYRGRKTQLQLLLYLPRMLLPRHRRFLPWHPMLQHPRRLRPRLDRAVKP
jgi:hypothetical protein